MGKRIEYYRGQIVGPYNVTYIKDVPNVGNRRHALFMCPLCRTEFTSNIDSVVRGLVRSCSCYVREKLLEVNTTHNLSNHPLYSTWLDIKNRCYNTKTHKYKYYGGRGITLYQEWRDDFRAFYDHIITLDNYGKEGYTLDREENDEGYYPGNLRWADKQTQSVNTRRRSDNKSGYTGVYCGKYGISAYIGVNNKLINLGKYKSIKAALQARNDYIVSNALPHKIQQYDD